MEGNLVFTSSDVSVFDRQVGNCVASAGSMLRTFFVNNNPRRCDTEGYSNLDLYNNLNIWYFILETENNGESAY